MMRTKDRLLAVETSVDQWSKVVAGVPGEDVMLMRLLRVASQGITSIIDPVLRESGLTESSYHTLILALASGRKGTTPSALCEQVGQNRANMTRILDLLAVKALIQVTPDAHDARRRRVLATPAGRKLAQSYAQMLRPILKVAFGALQAAEKRTLRNVLHALIESMDVAERMVGTR